MTDNRTVVDTSGSADKAGVGDDDGNRWRGDPRGLERRWLGLRFRVGGFGSSFRLFVADAEELAD